MGISAHAESKFDLSPLFFLSYSGSWIKRCPPTLVRVTIFIQSTDSNANLSLKHPHRHTQETMPYQLSGFPLAQLN